MLALYRAPNLSIRFVAQRAVLIVGQRQSAVQAVRRRENISSRGIQSIAQTDRVSQIRCIAGRTMCLQYNRTLSPDSYTPLELNEKLNVICASLLLRPTHLSRPNSRL